MRILVAEDDFTSRNILKALLEKNGHEVIPAENGVQAWEILRNAGHPRMIILDWMMPGIEGTELCRRVRAMETEQPPYIIMLTIKDETGDVISGLDMGADDYLCKPYDPGELRARVDVGLRMLKLQDILEERMEAMRANDTAIHALLADKELLLREVHHRLKNNMNTMGSILSLQADTMEDPAAATALREAMGRMQSMGILYDKLYRSENVREMSVRDYLPVLVNEVMEMFPDAEHVQSETRIDDFVLGAKSLSTLGIIVNELVANAMKHGLSGKTGAILAVSAVHTDTGYTVVIQDNGTGIPESVDFAGSHGFGMRLVKILTEQMNGTIRIERQHGTRIVMEFPVGP